MALVIVTTEQIEQDDELPDGLLLSERAPELQLQPRFSSLPPRMTQEEYNLLVARDPRRRSYTAVSSSSAVRARERRRATAAPSPDVVAGPSDAQAAGARERRRATVAVGGGALAPPDIEENVLQRYDTRDRHRLPPSILYQNEAARLAERGAERRRHSVVNRPESEFRERVRETSSPEVGLVFDIAPDEDAPPPPPQQQDRSSRRWSKRYSWFGGGGGGGKFRDVFAHGEAVEMFQEEQPEDKAEKKDKRKASRRLTEAILEVRRTVKRRIDSVWKRSSVEESPPPEGDQSSSLERRVQNYPYPSARERFERRERRGPATPPLGNNGLFTPGASDDENTDATSVTNEEVYDEDREAENISMVNRALDLPTLEGEQAEGSRGMSRFSRFVRSFGKTDKATMPPPDLPALRQISTNERYGDDLVRQVRMAEEDGRFQEDARSDQFADCPGANTSPADQNRAAILWYRWHDSLKKRADRSYRQKIFWEPKWTRPWPAGPKRSWRNSQRNLSEPAPTTESMTREERLPWKWFNAHTINSREHLGSMAAATAAAVAAATAACL